jgi:hypothetical protein
MALKVENFNMLHATPILNQQEEKLTLICVMMPYSQIHSINLVILYISLRCVKFGT